MKLSRGTLRYGAKALIICTRFSFTLTDWLFSSCILSIQFLELDRNTAWHLRVLRIATTGKTKYVDRLWRSSQPTMKNDIIMRRFPFVINGIFSNDCRAFWRSRSWCSFISRFVSRLHDLRVKVNDSWDFRSICIVELLYCIKSEAARENDRWCDIPSVESIL